LRALELRSFDDPNGDPPIPSDEDPALERANRVDARQAEAAQDPRATSSPRGQLLPELSGMLSRAFGIDVNAWDRAVADLLDEAGAAGNRLLDSLDDVDLWSWLIATSAAAISLEIVRRESRRARLDAIVAWGDELLGEVDL
jgi:hypothetical protein